MISLYLNNKKKPKENGFSMVEVLIAGILLASALTAVSRMSIAALSGNAHTATRTNIEASISDNIQTMQKEDSYFTSDKIKENPGNFLDFINNNQQISNVLNEINCFRNTDQGDEEAVQEETETGQKPLLDAEGNPVFDKDGDPIMIDNDKKAIFDAEGNPIFDANKNPILDNLSCDSRIHWGNDGQDADRPVFINYIDRNQQPNAKCKKPEYFSGLDKIEQGKIAIKCACESPALILAMHLLSIDTGPRSAQTMRNIEIRTNPEILRIIYSFKGPEQQIDNEQRIIDMNPNFAAQCYTTI
jgi:type II secretory pathway pseudopilin PulG